jgi:ABC-type lipoprotein export system ATPase subunit
MKEIIRLESVVKLYPPGRRAVNGVSLSVKERERVCICGAPGSGKTTLMRLIAGMESVSAGSIFVDEKPIHTLSAKELADFRNRTFGVLQRVPGFMEPLSVLENVALPLSIRRVPLAKREAAAREQLKSLGVPQLIHAKPAQLSPYEAQFVSLARAFITRPQILLLDDMTAGLSAKESGRIIGTLSMLWQSGDCALLSGGDNSPFPFDKRFILAHGKLQEVES